MKQPIPFGIPNPWGRAAGDCCLCQGEEDLCDCQLSYDDREGAVVSFRVIESDGITRYCETCDRVTFIGKDGHCAFGHPY